MTTEIIIFIFICLAIITWGGYIIYQNNRGWKTVDKISDERNKKMLEIWIDSLNDPYPYRGLHGQFGYRLDKPINDIYNQNVIKANELVDEYNKKINSFDTEKENTDFANSINEKINLIFAQPT